MKTFHTFKNKDTFQKFLRSGKYGKEQDGTLDYVRVGGILYTMHEYDDDGKYITWGNKKRLMFLCVETSDRYKNGYGDAQVSEYPAIFLRDDIEYAE